MNEVDLPSGWVLKKADEIRPQDAKIIYGILQPGPDLPSGIPYVRPTEIQDGEIRLGSLRRTSPEIAEKYRRSRLEPGDVLLSIVGTIGKVAVVPPELDGANITQSSARLRPDTSQIGTEYLRHLLRSPQLRKQFDKARLGTGVPRLNLAHVRALDLPVAPLPEQRRIVARIESLQARSRRAKEALDAIPPLLERFRQSVLAAAFRGDLTADWRRKNRGVEPASVLLERIRVERKRRWIDAEAEKARSKAEAKAQKAGKPWTEADDRKALEAGRKRAEKRYKEPEPVDPEGLPDLPEGWCWSSIEALTTLVTSGSRGWGKYYAADGPLFLRVGNLDRSTIALDLDQTVHVRPPAGGEGARTALSADDVLLSITADVGMVGVVPPALGEAYINQHVALLRPVPGLNPRCFAYSLTDPKGLQAIVRDAEYGATKASLSLIQVRGFPVPVPSLAEQEQIVSALDDALRAATRFGGSLNEGTSRVGRLDAAVLAKAFRGEL